MLVGMSRASGLIGKDSANRLEIFFGIVLQGEILLLDGTADHDQSAAGVQAQGQQRCDRHSHRGYTFTALDPLIFHFSLTGCVVHLRVTPGRAAFSPTHPVAPRRDSSPSARSIIPYVCSHEGWDARIRPVPRLGHRTAEPMRSCCTTASTVRWSVHAKRQRAELHSRAAAKHCTVELRRRSMRASHPDTFHTARGARTDGLTGGRARYLLSKQPHSHLAPFDSRPSEDFHDALREPLRHVHE